jgi:hypothetical protein
MKPRRRWTLTMEARSLRGSASLVDLIRRRIQILIRIHVNCEKPDPHSNEKPDPKFM